MNGSTTAAIPRRSFGETMRPDVWWLQPLLVFLGLSTFIVYSTWAAFQGACARMIARNNLVAREPEERIEFPLE